eukprot:m.177638 g.177638  ORF g.177638 m.177638 type:complete len:372 (+) comp17383_c0_seq17:5418-6533(+)
MPRSVTVSKAGMVSMETSTVALKTAAEVFSACKALPIVGGALEIIASFFRKYAERKTVQQCCFRLLNRLLSLRNILQNLKEVDENLQQQLLEKLNSACDLLEKYDKQGSVGKHVVAISEADFETCNKELDNVLSMINSALLCHVLQRTEPDCISDADVARSMKVKYNKKHAVKLFGFEDVEHDALDIYVPLPLSDEADNRIQDSILSVFFENDTCCQILLTGGPGQGKSMCSQMLAILLASSFVDPQSPPDHLARARSELNDSMSPAFAVNRKSRLPLYMTFTELQMAWQKEKDLWKIFATSLFTKPERSVALHKYITSHPSCLILDGFDEVDPSCASGILETITFFLEDCKAAASCTWPQAPWTTARRCR